MPSSTPARQLGRRRFTVDDQAAFAAASGDVNPMHMDALAARRLLSGRQVVHGVHTLLQALDLWQLDAPSAPRWQLECSFAQPVNVGDEVVFEQFDAEPPASRIVASVDGQACTDITLAPLANGPGHAPLPAATRAIDALPRPLDEAPGSQLGQVFAFAPQPGAGALAQRYPRAAERLGPAGVTALAQLSYFVGMVCPGQHSVFSSLRVASGGADAAVRLQVRRYDPRFRLYVVDVDGPLQGELRAFMRPPPQPQPSAREAAARLAGHEFAGTRSLVIGGSRGLGETTAKLIAAGGGDVVLTYAQGAAEAQAVTQEVADLGRGRAEARHFDLMQLDAGFDALDPARLDAVYFFATPRIYTKRKEVFTRSAFDAFVDVYLQRFADLCLRLDALARARPIQVYLPSTVFIDERPKGMTEYAMAKAAAEVLADDLNRSLRHVRVTHTRLPRLVSDQTASVLGVETASNLDVLLDVVRQMSSAISSL